MLLTLFAWLAGYWLLSSRRAILSEVYLQSQTDSQTIAWKAMLKSHRQAMNAYFQTIVMRPEVINCIEKGDRQGLYRLLEADYRILQKNNVRQLHFHTADNRSFLRFHAPEYHGDSLVKDRPSVVRANRYLQPVHGFESGRVVVGFRNIFPIVWQGKHLGSVELSQPFEALRKELLCIEPEREFQLFLKKDQLWPKLIEDWKGQYQPTCLGADWLVEKPVHQLNDSSPQLSSNSIAVIQQLVKNPSFKEALMGDEALTFQAIFEDKSYKVTILPQIDVLGKRPAVLLSFAEAPELTTYRNNFYNNMIVQTLLILFGGIMLYLYLYQRKMLKGEQRDLSLITSTIADGIYVVDERGRIVFANPRTTEILGYSIDELLGNVAHDLFHRHPEHEDNSISDGYVFRLRQDKTRYEGDELFCHKDGRLLQVHVASQPMLNGNRIIGLVTVFRDISAQKAMEDQLRLLSVTDPLTGVYNRRFLQETLLKELYRVERHEGAFTLVMLDIDHFKQINDRFGHDAGDKVLQHLVDLIKGRIRASDCLARWGGEEFLLLLPNTALEDGSALARNLLDELRNSCLPEVGTFTASFGVAAHRKADTVETVINRADELMYAAKQSGRNRVVSDSV